MDLFIGAGLEPRSMGARLVPGSVGPVWCWAGQPGTSCLGSQGQAWILNHIGLPGDSLGKAGAGVCDKDGFSLHFPSLHAEGTLLHASLHRLEE